MLSHRILRGLAPLLVALPGLGACVPIATTDAGPTDAGVPPTDAPEMVRDDASRDASADAGPPTAIFVAPHEGDDPSVFFDLPWPSEARVTPVGTPEVASFPAPTRGLIRDYLDAIGVSQDGYSTMGSVYFRFSHDVERASLPGSLEASVALDASVFLAPLVDGATELERHPIVARFEPRVTEYWPGRTLAIRPADGFPLLPGTLYAAVVTRRVRTVDGAAFGRDEDLEALLAEDASVAELARTYGPAIDRLEALGVSREDVLSIAIFRTQDPTELLAAATDWVHDEMAPPVAEEAAWSLRETTATHTVLHGRYVAPTFQEGEIPYATEGGGIRLDPDGRPVVHGTFEARFSLAVPLTPMPEGGYPIALYGHGTGGDFRSVIDDETAAFLASRGIAAMGIDAPLHGARYTGGDGTLFFNIVNPDAVRWNPVQGALDHSVQAVVAASLVVPRAVLERDGREIRFDPSRLYYVGHSQGALVGPLFFGVDAAPRAALFSAGGSLIGHTLREKTAPIDIPTLVRSLLGFSGATTEEAFEREGFTLEHPVVTILQGWIDVSDPGNYGPLAIDRPRAGRAPRSVLITEGLMDPFVAPASMEALAVTLRVPIAAPVAREIAGLELLGIASEPGEVRGNLRGGVTGALLQFPDDGHFAFFDDERGRARIGSFFASLLEGGPGTLPGP